MGHFDLVSPARVQRSVFDLSYEKKLTCDMGELIPVLCDEMVPGDYWKIGNQIAIRVQPLVAPILHEINVFVHYFFVPYRILWDEWEDFITGGPTGSSSAVLPTWTTPTTTAGSLWDYLGLPTGVTPAGAYPLDFIRRAYNRIYNEYYRDESLITEVAETNEAILYRAWEKDYFTSALLNQQRGTAPALPISGIVSATWANAVTADMLWTLGSGGNAVAAELDDSTSPMRPLLNLHNALEAGTATVDNTELEDNEVDLSGATTFDVSDLRLAFQIQKWLERNNRAGARYTEFLRAHFGVSPRDERLQRPEYIGGSRAPVVISEVLQTSESATTPQGTLAGHGITIDRRFIGSYHAKEFGVMMGIMSIMPRTAYQQGINRQWLRRTKYDFYFPEFAHLSEQAIERCEIYADGNSVNNLTTFGYAGRYDEMRVKSSMVVAGMRNTFDYWHLGRQFASAPSLNQTFIECIPDKRIFAVEDEDGFIVSFGNAIKASRPMPVTAEPGFIDH